jgi:magnesium transporter
VVSAYVHRNGDTTCVEHVDPAWLEPASGVTLWVDVVQPTPEEGQLLLTETFRFHPLSVEDALSTLNYPKIESYGSYVYLVLHGIDFRNSEHEFATRDVDFFLGPNYLVTVHDGQSRSIAHLRHICSQHDDILAEGPIGILHRIIDSMVDNYRPEVEALEKEMDDLEDAAILGGQETVVPSILALKRDVSSLRRVVLPQRDVVGRLARREFSQISDEMAYRFRDVYDQLVRLSDDAIVFQDRITGVLAGHLSIVSNRLNQVMKVLTVMSTIFLPLTVLTGMWGMNVPLPHFPGGADVQFWWVAGLMLGIPGLMLWFFRRKGWV